MQGQTNDSTRSDGRLLQAGSSGRNIRETKLKDATPVFPSAPVPSNLESVLQRVNRILESKADASIDPSWLWKARLAACVSAIATTAAGPLYAFVDVVVHFRLWTISPFDDMWLGVLGLFLLFPLPYVLVFVQLRKNPPAASSVGLAMGTAAAGLLFTKWMATPDTAVGPRWLWLAGAILSAVVQLLVALIYVKIYFLLGKQKHKALGLIVGSIMGLSLVVVFLFIALLSLSMPYKHA